MGADNDQYADPNESKKAKKREQAGGKAGKVSGTDNYGQGGPDASAGKVPGKGSGTDHLPAGPNGQQNKGQPQNAASNNDANANANQADKQGAVSGNQNANGQDAKDGAKGQIEKGGGKGAAGLDKDGGKGNANHIAGPAGADKAKGDKKGHAKDVGDVPKGTVKGDAGAGVADAAGPKAAGPMYTAKAVTPAPAVNVPAVNPIAPVAFDAPARVSKSTADKWLKETGRSPEVHHQEIQAAVQQLTSEIQAAQNELVQLGQQLEQKTKTEIDSRTSTFTSSVTGPGRARVVAAYTNIGKSVESASTKAFGDIATHKQNGAKQITATAPMKRTEVIAKLAAAKAGVKALLDKHAPAAAQTIQQFATAKVLPEIAKRKTEANNKAKQEVGDVYDPTKGSGDGRGQNALDGGKLALKNEIYQKAILAEGKRVGDEYEGSLKPLTEKINEQAPGWVAMVITEQIGTLDAVLRISEKTAVKAVDDNGASSTKTLDAQEAAAKKSVADTKASSKKRIETEQKAALEGADAAGQQLQENAKAAGTELTERIKKKTADDAAAYATITKGLQATLKKRGPHRFEQIQPQIAGAKAQLLKLHETNKQDLEKLASGGVSELGATLAKHQETYLAAIKNREEEATRVEAEIKKDIGKGAEDLGASLASIGASFTGTATKEIAKIDLAVQQFNTSAEAGLADFTAKLTAKLNEVKDTADKAFDEDVKEPFAKREKVVSSAEEQIKQKEKEGVEAAGKLRGAFDGYGTDEEAVFSALRTRSYGEIEFLQGAYNHHYDNRGQGRQVMGMKVEGTTLSPLKYDIDDEMSGSDFKIAMAYLEHRRNDAIQAELKQSQGGMFGTDGKRVEAVLRTCSEEEIHHLNTDEKAKQTVLMCKVTMMDRCSLDVMSSLLDEKMSKEERTSKADAIRLFDAMQGWGTDEAKMTEILEGAKTEEERARLRKAFNDYAKERHWETGDSKDENNDALALAIKDDTEDGERAVFLELAKTKRDEGVVKMAKAYKAADGVGTDEAGLFDALDDEKYAEEYEKASPEEKKDLEKKHRQRLTANLRAVKGQDPEKGSATIEGLIESETTKCPFTWQQLLDGVDKDGKPLDQKRWKTLLRSDLAGYLEYLLAERTLQIGKLDPTLALAYACWGVSGTDEELINKAISKGGEPLAQGTVKKIKSDFREFWGVALVENEDEFKTPCKDPGGLLSAELGGKDWFKTRILLCGVPENAKQEHYVNNLRFDYASSGALGGVFMDAMEAVGATEAKSTAEHSRKREQEFYQQNFVDKKIEDKSYADIRKDADEAKKQSDDPAKKKDPKAIQEALQNAANVDEFLLLSKEMEIDATAYAETKSALIDAVITTLELIGGVLISIGTMGAGSPILAAFLANLAMSAGGIILKAAIKGDQYGTGDFATDAIAAIGSAGFSALGETKAVMNAAEGVGKRLTGTVFRAAEEGLEKGGMKVAQAGGKWGVELSKEGVAKVERIVAAGTKNVMMSTGQEVYGFVTDEKTYEMKLGEALWGENSLGKRILANAPRAFAEGAVSHWINEASGASNLDYPNGTIKHAKKNALWNAISEMGGNTAGFFLYPDNYGDAEHFWIELFKSNVQKGLTGYATGYLMHRNRHKKLAAEFIRDDLNHEGLMNVFHHLDDIERKKLAEFVMQHGTPAKKAALPEEYQKYLNQKPPAPTDGANGSQPVANPNTAANQEAKKKATDVVEDAKKNTTLQQQPSTQTTDDEQNKVKHPAVTDEKTVRPVVADEQKAKPHVVDEDKSVQPVGEDEKTAKPAVASDEKTAKPVIEDEAKKQAPVSEEAKTAKPVVEDEETKPLTEDEAKKNAAIAEKDGKKAKASAEEEKATPKDDEKVKVKPVDGDEQARPVVADPKTPSRDEKIAAQKEQGHAGIEVHSHFLGNVEPTTFRAVIAESGLAPMKKGNPAGETASERIGDTTSWEPVLREIVALEQQEGFGHTYKMKDGKPEIDPETNKPVIEKRGVTGDAIAQAKAAQKKIETLKEQLADPDLKPKEREKIKDAIYRTARSAAEKALRASDETDFNSSYEVRDELIKKFYGDAARKEVLQKAGLDPNASFDEAADTYRKHFEEAGRPEVVQKIEEAKKAQQAIAEDNAAKKSGKPGLSDKQRKTLEDKVASVSQQFAYDRFAKDTILRLVQDGLTYTEQSNSSKKLAERFDPEQIAHLKKELIAEHPDLAEKIEAFQVKHIAMLNTSSFGTRDGTGVDTSDIADKGKGTRANKKLTPEQEEELFKSDVRKVVEQTKRGDVVGVDIAGAETFTFDEKGAQRFGHLYEELYKAAVDRGQPIVLRPHVGEGANDMVAGKHGARDTDRQMVDGELSHYKRAKENLDALLTTLEGVAAKKGKNGKLPPEVVVRFGHATHATPEQAARMAKLGIIAEVNLSSNIETGSVSQKKPKSGTEDNKRGFDDTYPEKNNSHSRGGKLEDHSLANLILNDVPIILSTDGHSVMSTSMKREYDLANAQIDKILAGKQKIPMTGEQARALGVNPKKLKPDGDGVVHIKITDIPADKRGAVAKKFEEARHKFYEAANEYYDKRPKQDDKAVKDGPDDPGGAGGRDPGRPTETEHKNVKAPKTKGQIEDSENLDAATNVMKQTFADETADVKLVGPPKNKPVLLQSPSDALIGLPMDAIPPTANFQDALKKFQEKGIPRWGQLTEKERMHETAFANRMERELPVQVEKFFGMSQSNDDKNVFQFEVDKAKQLYARYGQGSDVSKVTADQAETRATANHALHPTAVALARLAFLKRLDEMAALPKDHQYRNIFVTNGGCGAGKGSLFGLAGEAMPGKKFGAVWDAAGEGDASENGWILAAASKRGLKVTYGFAENDPASNYKGVLDRAESTGRIVDPVTYQRSYVRGQEAMKQFLGSKEYLEALAKGDVEAIGLNIPELRAEQARHKKALETDPEAKKNKDAGKMGKNGYITADDIKTEADDPSLNEVAVTDAAAKIFKEWVDKKREEYKNDPKKLQQLEWFVEGGATNTMKFQQAPDVNADPATIKARLDADLHEAPLGRAGTDEHTKSKKVERPTKENRQGVPETVPVDRDEIRAYVNEHFTEVVAKYAHNLDKKTKLDPEHDPYAPLLKELRALAPGELAMDRDKAKEIMGKFTALAKKLAAEEKGKGTNSREQESNDLRDMYTDFEQKHMKPMLKDLKEKHKLPPEVIASLAHMMREEVKVYTRDLMTNESATEALYLRDRAVYGYRRGPSFDEYVKELIYQTGSEEAAYEEIVKKATESNAQANEAFKSKKGKPSDDKKSDQ